jgi:hypothetical protein
MSGIDDLLRHTLEVRVTTESPPKDAEGEDLGHGVIATSTAATLKGLVQPRTARERLSVSGRDVNLGSFRIYVEAAGIGTVTPDVVIRKSGAIDADLNGDYRVNYVGNAAGWGHHLELDADRLVV